MADTRVPFNQALMVAVAQLTKSFNVYAQGGFKFNEVLRFFFEAIDELSTLGMQYVNMDPARQEQEVIAALKAVYMSRNVDIPWITEPFETMAEQALFSYVLPQLYAVLVRRKMENQFNTQNMMSKMQVDTASIPTESNPLGQQTMATVFGQPLIR